MPLDEDIDRVALQEERLQFRSFDADTAWTLGTRLRAAAEAQRLVVAIEIQVNGNMLFFAAMPGATPDNIDWIRRKRNVVLRFFRSSYALSLQLRKQKTTLTEQVGLDLCDYATNGGCFPIKLQGSGCIGTISVSGLPQRVDHELIIQALADVLELPYAEIALEPCPGSHD